MKQWSNGTMKLSIIIPVYNEEKTISAVLKKVIAVKIPWEKEIIVVDDGSNDKTKSQILKLKSQNHNVNLKTFFHHQNQGKGKAVRTGIRKATGDYILIQDADLEYNPEEIPNLLSPLTTDHLQLTADNLPLTTDNRQPSINIAVYGSRFLKKGAKIPSLYLLGNKFLTFLTNLLYGTNLSDMETGYKLLPSYFLKKTRLTGRGFDIEPEITAKLVKKGFKIIEVPISYHGRTHLAGKKLTVKDGLGAMWMLLRDRIKE